MKNREWLQLQENEPRRRYEKTRMSSGGGLTTTGALALAGESSGDIRQGQGKVRTQLHIQVGDASDGTSTKPMHGK